MRTWSLFDAVEWLLKKCRDEGAIGPDAVPVGISLTGEGSSSEPPGESIREALEYARKQAFEFFPDGWVCLHGSVDPETESVVPVYITKQGKVVLERRERSRSEADKA